MTQNAEIPPTKHMAPYEFASLPLARAYVDTVRNRLGSGGSPEQTASLERLEHAYDEFPELELDQPRRELKEALRSAEKNAANPMPMHMQEGAEFSGTQVIAGLRNILGNPSSDDHPVEIDIEALEKVALSARHRLRTPPYRGIVPRSTDRLLAMAERLRATVSPRTAASKPDVAWPSGPMTFDEFLLQWPCEIELPADLSDEALVQKAYQAILLREPSVLELDQSLRLIRNSVVSRYWIIEDLLASVELRSLDRRLRVICGDRVIVEPGRSDNEKMPAVSWHCRAGA